LVKGTPVSGGPTDRSSQHRRHGIQRGHEGRLKRHKNLFSGKEG